MKSLFTLTLVALLCTAPAYAGNNNDAHSGHMMKDGHMMSPSSEDTGKTHDSDHSGAVDIYAPAMETMHEGMMSVEPSGDADVDFVRGMIPHHQGAIDMAKILKEKGKDPELQSLADGIIAAQEKEIAFMKDWLKRHGK